MAAKTALQRLGPSCRRCRDVLAVLILVGRSGHDRVDDHELLLGELLGNRVHGLVEEESGSDDEVHLLVGERGEVGDIIGVRGGLKVFDALAFFEVIFLSKELYALPGALIEKTCRRCRRRR